MNPFNAIFAWPIALSLCGIVAIAATYDALVPSRPQRGPVDLDPPRVRQAERELAMGPDYWRGGRGRTR